ncbi:MAG: FixH family protein [Pseudomonadota bacterium]|nr:FixH family protein [Pseudomonadota bacterium]HJO35655.1 FixH family protein [Gammaproteobacteria bacterium]
MRAPSTAVPGRPWYREPLVWLLWVPPLAAVAGGVTMLVLALQTPEAAVFDRTERLALAVVHADAQARHAAALGLAGELQLDRQSGQVQVQLSRGSGPFGIDDAPGTLTLRFIHPTQPQRDRTLALQATARTDVYTGTLAPAPTGAWQVRLHGHQAGAEWQLAGTLAETAARTPLRAGAG